MRSPVRPALVWLALIVSSLLPVVALHAAAPASDNAANAVYGDGWQTGDNGGTGFTAWNLGNNNNGTGVFAGYFIGDSTAGSGNINTGNVAFGIYANPSPAFATAQRSFSGGALLAGETFSLQLAVNFRNGSKGFNLRDSGNANLFGFNVSGDDYTYNVNGGAAVSLGFAYASDSVVTLSFAQTNATTELVTITRTSAGTPGANQSFSGSFTLTGASGFELYNSNTGDGSSQNNLYANNLQVVPEPGSLALLGVGGLLVLGRGAVVTMSRRRRARTAAVPV